MTNICLYQRQICPTRAPYGAIMINRMPHHQIRRRLRQLDLQHVHHQRFRWRTTMVSCCLFCQHFSRFCPFQVCCFFLNWFFRILSWPGVPLRLTRMAMWWIMPGETVLMAVLAHVSIFVKIWETRPKLAYSWQDLGWDHIGPLGPGFSSGRYILGFLNISLHASSAQLGLDIVD